MEIIDPEHSGINLFDDDWKIYSRNSGLPGHKIGSNAVIENAMITNGCRINGHVNHSILFAGVTVEEGADVQDAVVMDNVVIKAGAKVRHCIVGENAVIGANTIVGAMPADGENGVATVGPGIKVGDNAVIGPKAMINSDVKDGDTQW
jgi:glucose-1-phosphate adenylyltransferase